MSFISKIFLENFQSHKKTILKLSKGLNVIWGEGDHGKSSILRAIKWTVINRPLGDEFRRHNTKKTSVTIIKDKNKIQRRKSDSKNEYKLNKEKPFKALGQKVPEEISSTLNLSESNTQAQHEVYFLVDQTPGKRSKILNEVAGLEIMDKTLKKTNSEIRTVNADIKAQEKSLEIVEDKIKNLEWIKKADKFLSKLEAYKEDLNKFDDKYLTVTKLILLIQRYNLKRKEFFSTKFKALISQFIGQRDMLRKNVLKIKTIEKCVQKAENLQEQLNNIRIIDVSDLKKQRDSINSMQNTLEDIEEIIEEINFRKIHHIQAKKEIKSTNMKIKQELKRIGRCPLCQNTI